MRPVLFPFGVLTAVWAQKRDYPITPKDRNTGDRKKEQLKKWVEQYDCSALTGNSRG